MGVSKGPNQPSAILCNFHYGAPASWRYTHGAPSKHIINFSVSEVLYYITTHIIAKPRDGKTPAPSGSFLNFDAALVDGQSCRHRTFWSAPDMPDDGHVSRYAVISWSLPFQIAFFALAQWLGV